jgi:hypothetical protein
VRLRESEVRGTVELLETEFANEREAATVVYNGILDLAALRKSYVVSSRLAIADPLILRTGPFYDLRSAKRAAAWWSEQGLITTIGNVYPDRTPFDAMENPYCSDCAHTKERHVIIPGKRRPRCLAGCGCGAGRGP